MFRSKPSSACDIKNNRNRLRMQVERLDERLTPSAMTFNPTTGVLTLTGSEHQDVANVSVVGTNVRASLTSYHSAPPNLAFYEKVQDFPLASVKRINFYGLSGHDSFTNNTAIPCTADGGSGDDILKGGGSADVLRGSLGNDVIYGNAGNDDVQGGTGNDKVFGGIGNDILRGGSGNDSVYGGTGNDRLFAGAGVDVLYGEAGNDVLVSIGGGIDILHGGSQWDNFWMDTTDILVDASSHENSNGYVHKVNTFFSYSFDGGIVKLPVSKELDGQSLLDPIPIQTEEGDPIYKHNFKQHALFSSAGPRFDDILQGGVGDCYFVASLSAIAKAYPQRIRNMVVDLGDGTYAVRFHRAGIAHYVRVDADLWTKDAAGTDLAYAKLGKENSLWVAIVEKAYAFFRRSQGTYKSIRSGDGTAPEHLNLKKDTFKIDDGVSAQQVINWFKAGSPNGVIKDKVKAGVKAMFNYIKAQQDLGRALIAGGKSGINNNMAIQLDDSTTDENESTFRRGQHVYMVDRVETDASGNPLKLVLRDPYGPVREISDLTRIYFCISSIGSMYP